MATALLVVFAGAAADYTENNVTSTWDGIWWATTTATTVGYGDIAPTTAAGRAVAIAVMLVGIGFISFLTAAIAARFVEDEAPDKQMLLRMEERLSRIEDRLDVLAAVLPGRAESDPGSR